ncbi:uncharacterized protein LY89DRAFT_665606 [Mollisia scopiformis]|uniref:Zn(2)-C6 fungal-type domain-containing protein n=1 Tax=Mollisia scopiformis TaxID=149040 RepID=A0A194XM42_MOLSC|nr:uncharacterized protein LY89DRAFT_665606 [Mollisia scopiformis]KUJ21154.1 hypothetical protein LY89DRAFT_665606 [Mollisia scopiformis]
MTSAMFGPNAMSMAMGVSSTSPGQSSPESFEIEEDSNAAQTSPTSSSQPSRAPAPLQKRRRVTRACDECRRKKIKCDGKQPCTHCTVYSYGMQNSDAHCDILFSLQLKLGRRQLIPVRLNPAPQYIEALENRLQRAETLLRTVLPNVDLNDPNIDALIQQRRQAGVGKDVLQNNAAGKSGDASDSSEQDAQLRSMIESTGQLDLDDKGNWDFHGTSSGTVFVRRMREQFGGLLGNDHNAPLFPRIPRPNVTPMFDSPRSSTESPMDSGLPNTMDLPSRENAKALCEDSLNSASSLLRFVHQPTFYEMFDRIYDIPPESFGDSENRFLPLLYMVLALGCMFHLEPGENPNNPTQNTYKAGIEQGLKYFRAARNMMDITDCRDITSLQAILFMILFLQSSANLSTCYSYIGVALRSALRQGLHRSLLKNFNPVELETRRRVFWVIRKMDTYVSVLLGFPQMLSNDDIDQELPLEVDDEYITKDGILEMPNGPSLLFQASNAHTRLMFTLAKVIKYIYPTKGLEESLQGNSKSSYGINHAKIREIERDLAAWLDKLPMALRPGGDGPPNILRVQQLLRLSYAHVQMMLYRPFLHYVSEKQCASKKVDERAYACAAACVSVSRNIVHITTEMKRRGLLVGAYWFTMYTTFFAILSLVYFVLENPDKPGSKEILADANDGKDALNGLARRSQAADRCSSALKGLFERLPGRLKDSRPGSAVPKKKRSAPSPAMAPQAGNGSPDVSQIGPGGLPRATTFPVPSPLQTSNLQRSSLDENRFPINTLSNPNLRQSYMSPTDLSAVGTPDSSSTNNSIPQRFPIQQSQFGINTAVPDLSAMMFPSADPFAYPNQAMAAFDNMKQENIGLMNNSQIPPMYLSNGNPTPTSGRYEDLEGQLFGPLPPYLSQGQQNYDLNSHLGAASGMMGGLSQDMNYHTGITPSHEMAGNFDGFFSGDGDNWSNSLADQRFG